MDLLIDYDSQVKSLRNKIKNEKRRLHTIFAKEHNMFLVFMDIAVAIIVLMNFGALFLTDYMLSSDAYDRAEKNEDVVTYVEASPAATKIHKLDGVETIAETKEEVPALKKAANNLIVMIIKNGIVWAVLLTLYIYNRRTMFTDFRMYLLSFVVAFYFFVLGFDFFHDLGLAAAKVVFG